MGKKVGSEHLKRHSELDSESSFVSLELFCAIVFLLMGVGQGRDPLSSSRLH